MRRLLAMGLLAGLLAAAGGCGGDALPGPDVVARIDGEEIVYAAFDAYLEENSVDPTSALGSDVLSVLFDRFLEEELVWRLALEREAAPPEATRREGVEALLAAETAGPITDEELRAAYERRRAEFELPERVLLRQILLDEEQAVEPVLAELAAGTPFEEVARRHSRVPGTGLSGDRDLLTRQDLPPAFVEPIFALDAGEVSEPLAADYGVHVFQVVERFPAGAVPLEEAAPRLREAIRRERSARGLERLVEAAAERYDVAVFERNLPFNYAGLHSSSEPDEAD